MLDLYNQQKTGGESDKYFSFKGKNNKQFSIYRGMGKGVTSLNYGKLRQTSENKKINTFLISAEH